MAGREAATVHRCSIVDSEGRTIAYGATTVRAGKSIGKGSGSVHDTGSL